MNTSNLYENLCLAKRLLLAQEKEVFRAAAIAIEATLSVQESATVPKGEVRLSQLKNNSWAAEDQLPTVQLKWLAQWCREGMADAATLQDCGSVWKRLYDVRRLQEFRENGKLKASVHPDVKSVLLSVFGPVSELEHAQFQRPSPALIPFDFEPSALRSDTSHAEARTPKPRSGP